MVEKVRRTGQLGGYAVKESAGSRESMGMMPTEQVRMVDESGQAGMGSLLRN